MMASLITTLQIVKSLCVQKLKTDFFCLSIVSDPNFKDSKPSERQPKNNT